MAPSVKIWTAVPDGGRTMSGTSFSAPIVSSYVAAAIKSEGLKDLSAVRQYLLSHTKSKGKIDRNKYNGWGLVKINPPC